MKISVNQGQGEPIAFIPAGGGSIMTVNDALDLLATVKSEQGCDRLVIDKSCLPEEFFDLRTGLAGEILQKYTNYGLRLAIVGDFSVYESKSLRDFIFECNKGKNIIFAATQEEAFAALA